MHSQKKRIRHRDRNYMIYMLTFLIMLTGMLGILKGSPVQAAEEESTQKGSILLVCPVEGMELSLYRVAEYEESGSFTLTERFRKYPGLTGAEEPGGLAGCSGCTGGLYQT